MTAEDRNLGSYRGINLPAMTEDRIMKRFAKGKIEEVHLATTGRLHQRRRARRLPTRATPDMVRRELCTRFGGAHECRTEQRRQDVRERRVYP